MRKRSDCDFLVVFLFFSRRRNDFFSAATLYSSLDIELFIVVLFLISFLIFVLPLTERRAHTKALLTFWWAGVGSVS